MSQLTILSLVSLVGWLVLMLFFVRRSGLPRGRWIRLGLIWAAIFAAMTLLVEIFVR